jgi:TonB family protein
MRMLGLVVGACSVLALAAPGGVSQLGVAPDTVALQRATADTISVTRNALQGLAPSEPDIVAPEGAPQAGAVWVKVLVSKTGEVEEAVAFQGDDALRQAVVNGVKGWKYKPFVQDGEPREIQSTILLNFRDGAGKRLGPIRVSAGVIAGLLQETVAPVYPPAAKAANVQGFVVLHALISRQGTIESLRVISGPPVLTAAALDAVKRWKYRPYLLNGEPIEVDTTINVNFIIPEPPKAPDAASGGSTGAAPPAGTPDGK